MKNKEKAFLIIVIVLSIFILNIYNDNSKKQCEKINSASYCNKVIKTLEK